MTGMRNMRGIRGTKGMRSVGALRCKGFEGYGRHKGQGKMGQNLFNFFPRFLRMLLCDKDLKFY